LTGRDRTPPERAGIVPKSRLYLTEYKIKAAAPIRAKGRVWVGFPPSQAGNGRRFLRFRRRLTFEKQNPASQTNPIQDICASFLSTQISQFFSGVDNAIKIEL